MEECGCAKSEDKTLDIIETLNKAKEPHDWDAGRFFSKKSLAQINELITILGECTLGADTAVVIEDNAESLQEYEAYANGEVEMITAFEEQANSRLNATWEAISQLISLSKSLDKTLHKKVVVQLV